MKYWKLINDKNKRRLFLKKELFHRLLKLLLLFENKSNIKQIIMYSYFKLSRIKYKSQIKNYCVVSGRSRSIYRNFKVSRILVRELSSLGLFFGLKKASW
jgi:small subunit ribosomal protein S14